MFLNSPRSGSSSNLNSTLNIASEDYLVTGSLLRGPQALALPASAGLPSAGGGVFCAAPPPVNALETSGDTGRKKKDKHRDTKPERKVRAIFVKTSRDASGPWIGSTLASKSNISSIVENSESTAVCDTVKKVKKS